MQPGNPANAERGRGGAVFRRLRLGGAAATVTSLPGCSGAPSVAFFGSYFPAWLACALIGLIAAIAARIVMGVTGLSDVLPFQLLVCLSLGCIAALMVAFLWLGL